MLFKFDNLMKSWSRSVWWRTSQQQQQVETIMLRPLPPIKELNMAV